jgi:hypothetical protein
MRKAETKEIVSVEEYKILPVFNFIVVILLKSK